MSEPTSRPAAVWSAIEDLEPRERRALVLVCVLGLSYAEAAAAMEVSIADLRTALVRARAALAERALEI
jgi:DNA-directed RNA polymerase specialized sigma24 family protein